MSSPAHLATDRPATYTIGARALRTALAAVMKHASKDTARPHLNGILLHADDGIVAVATDGDTRVADLAEDVLFVPEVADPFSPMVNVVALQLLAYFSAQARGTDIDKPRNLAKSVTVE